jgi:hypothetical protein
MRRPLLLLLLLLLLYQLLSPLELFSTGLHLLLEFLAEHTQPVAHAHDLAARLHAILRGRRRLEAQEWRAQVAARAGDTGVQTGHACSDSIKAFGEGARLHGLIEQRALILRHNATNLLGDLAKRHAESVKRRARASLQHGHDELRLVEIGSEQLPHELCSARRRFRNPP